MYRYFFLLPAMFALTACSPTPVRQTKMYQSGEKAEFKKLTYSIVDAQIFTRLGDDASPRIPQNRFYVVQLSVSNGGNQATSIPALTLVDDNGKTYPELADGAGIPRWLGVIRNVDPAQTEAGQIIFDAPSAHYRLRLTDETDEDDVFVDMPLNFLHEQMNSSPVSSSPDGAGAAPTPAPAVPAAPKKP